MGAKLKVIINSFRHKSKVFLLIFVSVFLIDFNYSYANNSEDNLSTSQVFYEKWDWLGDDEPIQIIKLEDIFDSGNSSKYRLKFKDGAAESYELRIYDPLGQEIEFINIDKPKNNGKDYKESYYSINTNINIKAGDLVTITICPKGKREEEKIIKQSIVRASPKPSDLVIVNKGYKFKENDEKLFIANTLEMPEETKYSFINNKPPDTSKIKNVIGESLVFISVKHPDRENVFMIDTKFYVDESYIPIVENMDYDQIPDSWHKLTFDPGEHGQIVSGKFSEMWIEPQEILGIPFPEVKVDRGYAFINDWDYIKDWDAKTATFKAKYEKLDDNEKESYFKIKFLADDDGFLEGRSEFLIPRGYSLSKMPEDFVTPKAIKNDGWIFDKWNPNFDIRLNIYSDMTFIAEFKEGQAIKTPPEVLKDFTTDANNVIEARNLIKNLDALPEGVKVEWSEKPDFSKKGKSIGKINIIYPDGSYLENIKINIEIQSKENEYKDEEDLEQKSEDDLNINTENPSEDDYFEDNINIRNPSIDEDLASIDNIDSSENLSVSEKIRALIIRLKLKLKGVEYIKKYMPYTYKRYQRRLDEAVRDVEYSIIVAEEYLK